MTDFQAALGYNQVKNYRNNLATRHKIAKRYIENLSKTNEIRFMPYSKDSSYFVFQIFCKNRDKILRELKKKKIGVSVHYTNPLPKMTFYKKKYNLRIKNFKFASMYGRQNISLPVYPKLKIKQVDKICKTILKLV
jgi:dTDP-4-amino-4,6-dideoxygalactose transaminase